MRIVRLSNLKGNEILAKPIYNDTGRILLAQGVKLTPFYIDRLKLMEIEYVFIDDDISKDVVFQDNITEKTRQMSKKAIKDIMQDSSGRIHNDGILKSVDSIIEDVLANKDVMINVSDIRSKDDRLYVHSINVCVLSTLVAIHMGYNMYKVKDVAIGAILHDIGKAKILNDKEIIKEKGNGKELTEYIHKMHPKIGYDYLGSNNICGTLSKIAVLMHHERLDGSGYPFGLKGDEINEVAMLVSICDTFDNLVSGQPEKKSMPIYEVLEYLIAMSGTYFNRDMVNKFIMNVSAFPSGSGVKLNTNEKCLVIRQNRSLPLRPVVKVLYDSYGKKIDEPYEIDLFSKLTLFITQSCEL